MIHAYFCVKVKKLYGLASVSLEQPHVVPDSAFSSVIFLVVSSDAYFACAVNESCWSRTTPRIFECLTVGNSSDPSLMQRFLLSWIE